MAKSAIILASALCFLSFLGLTQSLDRFSVRGSVYCDTCRIQFPTRISDPMAGATVRVECREFEGSTNITFSKDTQTDENGTYSVEVDGDHEEELCEVVLVKSPRTDCDEIDKEAHLAQSAKISITSNNGIVSNVRTANPLGFLKKEKSPECNAVLKELGILEDGTFV